MLGLFIGLLTLIMVLDCVVLVFLVLIQLPKKEAGAGLAFGGAATDALFGAGSGNVLTKVTKYSAAIFFILAVLLSFIQNQRYQNRSSSGFEQKLAQPSQPFSSPANPMAPQTAPATTPSAQPTLPPGGTGAVTIPQVEQPTTPTAPATPSATVPTTNAAPSPAPGAPAPK